MASFVAVVTVAVVMTGAATSEPCPLEGNCSTAQPHDVNLLQAASTLMPASSLKCLEGDWPDVGPPFRDEHIPRLDWLVQNSRKTLRGCTDEHAEDWHRPLREVLKPGEDGYCHFDFMTRCPATVRMSDYMPFAVADAQVVRKELDWISCPGGFEDGPLKTAPGVWVVDAQLCYSTGFIHAPRELLYNFSALTEYASQRCQEFKAQFPESADASWATVLETFPKSQTGRMSAAEWQWHEMTKCLLWEPHGLACDISYCLYNHCILPDGRVGQGLQCNEDFLSEDVMEKYGPAISGKSAADS